MAAPQSLFPGYDFYYYYAASVLLRSGGNPYDRLQLAATVRSLGWNPEEFVSFPNVPWVSWIIFPLSMPPFTVGRWAWLVLLMLTMLVVGWRVWTEIRERHSEIPQYIISFLSFPPVLGCFLSGNTSFLLLPAYCFFERNWKEGKDLKAGLWFSLGMIKPNLFVAIIGYIAAEALRGRRVKVLLGAALGVSLQVLIAMALIPDLAARSFIGSYISSVTFCSMFPGATPAQAASVFLGVETLKVVLPFVALIFGIWSSGRSSFSGLRVLLCVSLLCAPYAWSHSFIVLLPWYLEKTGWLWSRYGPLVRYPLTGLSVLGIAVSLAPVRYDSVYIILPILGLL